MNDYMDVRAIDAAFLARQSAIEPRAPESVCVMQAIYVEDAGSRFYNLRAAGDGAGDGTTAQKGANP